MELAKQDMSSMEGQCDPAVAMALCYSNALLRLTRELETHLDAIKEAADIHIATGLHKAIGKPKPCDIHSAKSVSELFHLMSIKPEWEDTCFLIQAVGAIPPAAKERENAEALLSHYNHHLHIYRNAALLRDDLARRKKKKSGCNDKGRGVVAAKNLVAIELTTSQSIDEFTCESCYQFQLRILSQAYGIPEDEITCIDAAPCKSTTIIFLVPNRFICIIMQRTIQLETMWVLLELNVIEVGISGFNFKPTVGCFLALLRGSKPFTADLLGVTEVRLWE